MSLPYFCVPDGKTSCQHQPPVFGVSQPSILTEVEGTVQTAGYKKLLDLLF